MNKAIALLALASCAPAAPRIYAQDVDIRVESDSGAPLTGVALVAGGKTLAVTAADGLAKLRLTGREGDSFHVGVQCPDGTVSAGDTELDMLVRRADDARIPEFATRCRRTVRRATVAIHAKNGGGLPILLLGKEIGTTDANGDATTVLDVRPGVDVELTLDTRGSKKIHPTNPVLGFTGPADDEAVTLTTSFTVEKAAPPPRARAPKGPKLPRLLGGAE